MKNKMKYALLFFPALILTGVMIYYSSESNYEKVELAVTGYDPKDFFSGYYMDLQIDWNNTDCAQFEGDICPKEEFNQVYRYHIKREQSDALNQKVNAGDAKLVFSYEKGHSPIVVDLKINGKSYADFIESIKSIPAADMNP